MEKSFDGDIGRATAEGDFEAVRLCLGMIGCGPR
jgi:hypothetical protein